MVYTLTLSARLSTRHFWSWICPGRIVLGIILSIGIICVGSISAWAETEYVLTEAISAQGGPGEIKLVQQEIRQKDTPSINTPPAVNTYNQSFIPPARISSKTSSKDPLEGMNRIFFRLNDTVDRAALRPLAEGYEKVVPRPVRTCVRNFFSNLGGVLVGANSLLQGQVTDALSDACRVLINTTIGLGGCFDVASDLGLDKHDRDFGQTLGKWGAGSGPYLVLPLLGPSNVRDGTGTIIRSLTNPVTFDHVPTRNQLFFIQMLSVRAEFLAASRVVDDVSFDPYIFVRDFYMQRRQSMIGGKKNIPEDEDDED